MSRNETVKILTLHPEKCNGCLDCEKACSQVQFKKDDGRDKSALRIIQKYESHDMNVCNQCGLCIDMCTVGALTRNKNGVVWLDKKACIGCQACVGFCPIEAMRKSDVRVEPFKCISCGACVQVCSEGALELVEVMIDEVKKVVYYKQGIKD